MAKSSCLLVHCLCLNLLLSIGATSELPVSAQFDHPQQSTFLPASTEVQDTPHGWLTGLLTKSFVGDQVVSFKLSPIEFVVTLFKYAFTMQ